MTTLAKLTIAPEAASGLEPIPVLFNPNTYSIVKSVSWKPSGSGDKGSSSTTQRGMNAPPLTFDGGNSRTLSLELFFDTTEETDKAKVDVRNKTNLIVKLTRIVRALERPPVCVVSWGDKSPPGSDFPFRGVVTQLTQHFNLFRAEGPPVRATLSVQFTEWLDPTNDKKETDPEFTTRLTKRGDTLSSIAAEVYSDPTQWRTIAEANGIDDPRQLAVGMRLSIPTIH